MKNYWKGRRNEKIFVDCYEAQENLESTDYKKITDKENICFFALIVIISMLLFVFYLFVHAFTPAYEQICLYAVIGAVAGGAIVAFFGLLISTTSHNRQLAHDRAMAAATETFHPDIYDKVMKTKNRRDYLGFKFIDDDVYFVDEPDEKEEPIEEDYLLTEESIGQDLEYMINHDENVRFIMQDEIESEETNALFERYEKLRRKGG